jgi:hypothetical protein
MEDHAIPQNHIQIHSESKCKTRDNSEKATKEKEMQ